MVEEDLIFSKVLTKSAFENGIYANAAIGGSTNALPVNEYLFAIIIIQLLIRFPLLAAWYTSFACPKEVSRKRHPKMPALRAPLVLLLSGGTPKNSLALRQVWRLIPPPALLLGGIKRGAPNMRVLFQVRVYRMNQLYLTPPLTRTNGRTIISTWQKDKTPKIRYLR